MKRRYGIIEQSEKIGARLPFTMIELMVVVAIIAIISGMLLPILAKARDKARKARSKSIAKIEEENKTVAEKEEPEELPKGELPYVDHVGLKMALASSYDRVGMDVYTNYRVNCKGQITYRAPSRRTKALLMMVPLPYNSIELRNVHVKVSGDGGKAKKRTPEKLHYSDQGIYWLEQPAPGEELVVDVMYTAFGRESFVCDLPMARALGEVDIELDMSGVEARFIPENVLQPSSSTATTMAWKFSSLVSDRKIIVGIPGKLSPLGRIRLLFRLAAVAVLLFGAGFWYMTELDSPGYLRDFRWGHFLLLALNYCLFFIIFAVIGFGGSVNIWVAMIIAAALSLPLLVIHCSRIVNLKFAWRSVLPMAALTLLIVINGVYGGALRPYIYIMSAIIAVAYLTLTYGRWLKARVESRRVQMDKAERVCEEMRRRWEVILNNLTGRLQQAELDARQTLATALPDAVEPLRLRLQQSAENATGCLLTGDALHERLNSLANQDREMLEHCRDQLEHDLLSYQRSADQAINSCSATRGRIKDAIAAKQVDRESGSVHCLTCGAEALDRPYCPECGAKQPMVVSCTACNEELILPNAVLKGLVNDLVLHCRACGTKHQPVSGVGLKTKPRLTMPRV